MNAARVEGQRRYASGELERLALDVAAMGPGVRNAALNRAALQLGHLVGSGALNVQGVERRLMSAALACGLRAGEAAATIRSGLAAGAREPAFRREREPSGVRASASPARAAVPIDADAESQYQALVCSLVELCPMAGDVAAYLEGRGLPAAASGDVIALPAPPDQRRLLAELERRHGRPALHVSGLLDRSGAALAWPGHRLGFVWRCALSGRATTTQRRYLGAPTGGAPKTVFARGRSSAWPWGAHILWTVPRAAPVAIVEGVVDWLAWQRLYKCSGVPTCIALPSASALRPEWIDDMIGRRVFVALDSDEAGERASALIMAQLADCAEPLRLRPWPGCKDWGDRVAPSYRPAPDSDIERSAIQSEGQP